MNELNWNPSNNSDQSGPVQTQPPTSLASSGASNNATSNPSSVQSTAGLSEEDSRFTVEVEAWGVESAEAKLLLFMLSGSRRELLDDFDQYLPSPTWIPPTGLSGEPTAYVALARECGQETPVLLTVPTRKRSSAVDTSAAISETLPGKLYALGYAAAAVIVPKEEAEPVSALWMKIWDPYFIEPQKLPLPAQTIEFFKRLTSTKENDGKKTLQQFQWECRSTYRPAQRRERSV
jgi:hypothetical protein